MTETMRCRHCGAEFAASRGGTTVHCPAHRTAESRRAARATATGHRAVTATGRTCTVTVTATGGKCGKAAVHAFEATGEIFAECAEHH